jgi:hypothetical protein
LAWLPTTRGLPARSLVVCFLDVAVCHGPWARCVVRLLGLCPNPHLHLHGTHVRTPCLFAARRSCRCTTTARTALPLTCGQQVWWWRGDPTPSCLPGLAPRTRMPLLVPMGRLPHDRLCAAPSIRSIPAPRATAPHASPTPLTHTHTTHTHTHTHRPTHDLPHPTPYRHTSACRLRVRRDAGHDEHRGDRLPDPHATVPGHNLLSPVSQWVRW